MRLSTRIMFLQQTAEFRLNFAACCFPFLSGMLPAFTIFFRKLWLYANVNWCTYGQYKAGFPAHSNESGGVPPAYEKAEERY